MEPIDRALGWGVGFGTFWLRAIGVEGSLQPAQVCAGCGAGLSTGTAFLEIHSCRGNHAVYGDP